MGRCLGQLHGRAQVAQRADHRPGPRLDIAKRWGMETLAGGSLNPKVREQIALAVAESNMCGYCLSAHAFLAGKVGLTEKDINDARHATAGTEKTDAILKLARNVPLEEYKFVAGVAKTLAAATST